jgi:nucleoside phosphorylase
MSLINNNDYVKVLFSLDDIKDEKSFSAYYFKSSDKDNLPIIINDIDGLKSILAKLKSHLKLFLIVHVGGILHKEHQDTLEDFARYPCEPFLKQALKTYDGIKYVLSSRAPKKDDIDYFKEKYGIQEIFKPEYVLDLTDENPSQLVSDLVVKDIDPKNEDIDFAIVTALYEDEFTAFKNNAITNKSFSSDMTNLLKAKFKDDDEIDIDYKKDFLILHSQRMGMVDSTFNSTKILERYSPKYLIMGGVCGGKEGKKEDDKAETTGLQYLDIIIANNIFDIQIGKLEKGKFIPYLYNEELNPQLLSFIEQNKVKIKKRMLMLIDSTDETLKEKVENATIRIGDYGCGSIVINTDDYFKQQISERNNKAIAVEMESYSIYRSCKLHNTLYKEDFTLPLVIKSVMDYTDSHKTDEYKKDAARMSYLCIRACMPVLIEFHESIQKNRALKNG